MMRIVNKQERSREKKFSSVPSYGDDEHAASRDSSASLDTAAHKDNEHRHPYMNVSGTITAAMNRTGRTGAKPRESSPHRESAPHVVVRKHAVHDSLEDRPSFQRAETRDVSSAAAMVQYEVTEEAEETQDMSEHSLNNNKLPETGVLGVEERIEEPGTALQPVITDIAHPNPTTQLLLSTKTPIHRPEAGINPMVDAASHIFSVMGKLKHMKTHQHLDKLQSELIQDIENFLDTAQTYNYDEQYLPEYLLLTRYAICVTLDDIILSTAWGGQGKWDKYTLVTAFDQEPLSHQNFLIILERLVRDPDIYIDLMEFIYVCLSLGFKCRYNSSEFDHQQLEHISNALYKRIRAYRGNFSKILSPFSVRPAQPAAPAMNSTRKAMPAWSLVLLAGLASALLFAGGKYLLDRAFKHVNQSLTQTELGSYAKHNKSV